MAGQENVHRSSLPLSFSELEIIFDSFLLPRSSPSDEQSSQPQTEVARTTSQLQPTFPFTRMFPQTMQPSKSLHQEALRHLRRLHVLPRQTMLPAIDLEVGIAALVPVDDDLVHVGPEFGRGVEGDLAELDGVDRVADARADGAAVLLVFADALVGPQAHPPGEGEGGETR